MAETSPRGGGGGGCGGYSSRGSGRRRPALPRAPSSSAMFQPTSPAPRAASQPRRPQSAPAPAPARGHLLGPAATPPCAPLRAPPRPLPPAAPSARPGRLRAPTRGHPPARDSALPRAGAGSASRTSREQSPSTAGEAFVFPFCVLLFFSPPSPPGLNPGGWIPGGGFPAAGGGRAALEARGTPCGAGRAGEERGVRSHRARGSLCGNEDELTGTKILQLSVTPRELEARLQDRQDLLRPPIIAFKAGTSVFCPAAQRASLRRRGPGTAKPVSFIDRIVWTKSQTQGLLI
ncbi:translation initiation factor IF-2-like isoform X2 [Camelus ferus]|uniref:Translation initiation factor IF-2-like isoform X2 n=1 Tax=Camelus ferus TaxID=419612 RepID=A0A8B8SB29_CAMFR|nr:translation initiation factor IF-2-like isoform X2 [Camelus ferus]